MQSKEMDELAEFDIFSEKLKKQTVKKRELYDGVRSIMTPDYAVRLAMEELGEVSSALTRERSELALSECLDLAHTAFLIWLAIKRTKQE